MVAGNGGSPTYLAFCGSSFMNAVSVDFASIRIQDTLREPKLNPFRVFVNASPLDCGLGWYGVNAREAAGLLVIFAIGGNLL